MAKLFDTKVEGLASILRDFKKLPKEASKELRRASVDISTRHMVPSWKAAALTGGNWGPKLAESVRAVSDRLPALKVGKDKRVYLGKASTNMIRYPSFNGTKTGWPPFGDGTGWMANRRPYAAQALAEWTRATDLIVAKWNAEAL